ncbi:hypothetical protein GCM10011611_29970 [Aliidongia dinghuensis]|uniref:Transporter n=1 Tax=Aliidongia dinghuensis TaxID=1867774 RepID=A0A8J2YUX2_9PROT|nr:hypothetical protein [Aliidongia dinghuensis]GGF21915.1 hypothetical protein GCM10011611_29970 [Aliidongia dinghuensis]
MSRLTRVATPLFGAGLAILTAGPTAAHAHGIAGDRLFPATLSIDDPAVGDELSAPTFTYQPQSGSNGSPETTRYGYGFEWDKTITKNLGVAINDGYSVIRQQGANSLYGWNDLVTTLKYQFFESDTHEILASVGVQREWGGTGALRLGVDATGWTQPTLYAGKGMGDLPASVGLLRPFALTGELGYQFADVPTAHAPDGGVSHSPNFWNIGFSVQYDMHYLQAQVKDYGLPEFVNHLIPLVEFAYSTPATNGYGATTTGTIAPGVLYEGGAYQIGVEALIPATKASGTRTGVIAQLHFYLDDLLPTTLGKPVF